MKALIRRNKSTLQTYMFLNFHIDDKLQSTTAHARILLMKIIWSCDEGTAMLPCVLHYVAQLQVS
jgi:hypothetical protein